MKANRSDWVGVAVVAGLLIAGGAARGASYTWDGGGGDNNWGTLANWNPDLTGVGDLTGADLTFGTTAGSAGGSASTPAAANNDQSGLVINSLTVSGFVTTPTGWALTGNAFTISPASSAVGITISGSTSGKSVIISNTVVIGAAQTWTGSANSPLIVYGNLSGSANITLASTTADRVRLAGSNSGYTGSIDYNNSASLLTLVNASAMIGGNINMGKVGGGGTPSGSARLRLSGASSAGTYTFGLGTGNGQVNQASGYLASLLDGSVRWDPGNGGNFAWNTDLRLAGQLGDFSIGNASSLVVLTGGARQTLCNDNFSPGPVVEFKGGLSDDGTARNLTIHGSHLLVLTQPRSGGNGGGKIDGRVAISNMNQIFSGNLDNSGRVLILDNVSWSAFLAGRSAGFGGSANQFNGANFAARTADLVIDSTVSGFNFDRNFTLGNAWTRSGDTVPYANKSVIVALNTTLSAVRTITPDALPLTTSQDPARTIENRIRGDLSGTGAIVGGGIAVELVLAGHNTWSGTPTVTSGGLFSAGPGGLATIAGLIRFDDTQLASGTSIPQGNGGSAAFLATWGDNMGGGGVRGFLITGDNDGQVYTLPTGMKILLGSSATGLGNMNTGLFGSTGTNATLSNAAIVSHIGNNTAASLPYLFVRDGQLHLGDAAGPVKFQHATGATGSAPAASTLTEAGTTGVTNNEIEKIGIGTLVLDNVAYTDLSGAGDYSSNHKWTLGNGSVVGSTVFGGAVRETGTGTTNSIRGNASLGVTTMQGGVLELGVADEFTMQLGSTANRLNMAGNGGGGFAAFGGRRVVRLTNSSGVLGGDVGLNSGNFVTRSEALTFGSLTANGTAVLMNNITGGGGGSGNFMATVRGVGTAPEGEIAGNITALDNPFRIIARTTPWGAALPAGTLVFSGANTYAADTRIEAGTLLYNGSLSANASYSVIVSNGATLGGTGTVNRAITLNAGAAFAPGSSGIGALTTSNFTWYGGATYVCQVTNFAGTAGTGWDSLSVKGSLNFSNAVANTIIKLDTMGAPAANFSQNGSYLLRVANFVSQGAFDKTKMTFDLTAFSNAFNGTWSALITEGTNLTVKYTAPTGNTNTWGGITGNWSDDLKWQELIAPALNGTNAQVLKFGGSGGSAYIATNDQTSTGVAGTFVLNSLQLNSSSTATNVLAGATLQFAGTTPGLTQLGSGAFLLTNAADLAVDTTFGGDGNGAALLGGNVTGAAGLIKEGASVFSVNGSASYAGATVVNGGTLLINGSLTAGGADVSVAAGGTLAGTGTINRAVTVNAGGLVIPGNAGIGTLTVSNLSLTANATNSLDLGLTNASDKIVVNGDLALNGVVNVTNRTGFGAGTYTIMTYSGSLSGSGLTVGQGPAGYTITVDTSVPHEIRLGVIYLPVAPAVANTGGATGVGTTAATLNGEVTAGSPSPQTYICWGTSDPGTLNTGDWQNVTAMGIQSTLFATNLTTLAPNTLYYYRCYVTNTFGTNWSPTATSFHTLQVPAVDNGIGASPIGAHSATLNGQVTAGLPAPLVYVCWGSSDMGTTTGAWPNVVAMGSPAGGFSTTIANLADGTPYAYRCFATNSVGYAWSAVVNFTTANRHFTWDGGSGGNNWGALANWNPDLTAASDLNEGDLTFATTSGSAGGTAATPAIANNDQPGLTNNTLTFSGFPASSTGWLMTGNPITVSPTSSSTGITVSVSTAGKSVIVSNNVTLAASQTWSGSANSPLTLAGNLSGGAGVTVALNSTTSDRLRLSGVNSNYLGSITNVGASCLTLMNSNAMIGGNINLGANGNSRLFLSGTNGAGTFTFGVGAGNGQVAQGSGFMAGNNDGKVTWDPGNGGDFVWNTDLRFALPPGGIGVSDVNIGNSARRIVLTGGPRVISGENNYYGGNILQFSGGLSDDGSARNLSFGNSILLILTQPRSGGDGSGSITVNGGCAALAVSNMNQLFSGNLNILSGTLILDNISWSQFLAGRTSGYGGGANQWQSASFAARTTDLTIDTPVANFTFNQNFNIGYPAKRYGDAAFYANKSVVIALDTTLTAQRTINVAGPGPGVLQDANLAPIHKVSGSFGDNGATKGSLLVTGQYAGNGFFGELVLAGSNNTWSGSASRQVTSWFGTGPGGLMLSAGQVRFDDTGLPAGMTSIPHGNGGSLAYLASIADNDGGGANPVRGFLMTGSSAGRTYSLPSGMKFLLGDLVNGQLSAGLIGSAGTNATLANSSVVIMSAIQTDNQCLGLFVRDAGGVFTLGDASGAVQFQRGMTNTYLAADPGVNSAATSITDAIPAAGTTNATILKRGIGTIVLNNLRYTDLSGSGDKSSQYQWKIGMGALEPAWTFGGAVRETGTGPSNSLSGNPNLQNTVLQNGVIEIGCTNTFAMQLGAGAGQLRMDNTGLGFGGGFAAYGGYRTVALINSLGVANGPLFMSAGSGNNYFVASDQPLIFGSTTADNTVELTNPINVDGGNGGNVRYIATVRGTGTVPEGKLSGALSGARSLFIVGMNTPWGAALPAGAVDFAASNSLTSLIYVNAGTLLVNGAIGPSANGLFVTNNAALGGTGTIYRAVTLYAGATLAPGGSNVIGTLTIRSNLTLNAGTVVACDAGDSAMDRVVVNGTLTLPTNLTINVNMNANSALPAILFSATALAGTTNDLSGWMVTEGAKVRISGTDVILAASNRGTVFRFR